MKDSNEKREHFRVVPSDYAVLFMHGGGTAQFAAISQNLEYLSGDKTNPSASYLVTGSWSDKAANEAEKYLRVNKVSRLFTIQLISTRLQIQNKPYCGIPELSQINSGVKSNDAYLYYCGNETIHGIEFYEAPKLESDVQLVADISSNILGRPFDVSKHAVTFAGTQKNIGIAGLSLAIVKESLIGHANPKTPAVLNYEEIHKNNSVYNTPPCFR